MREDNGDTEEDFWVNDDDLNYTTGFGELKNSSGQTVNEWVAATGGGNVFVTTWYDQIDSNHLLQTTDGEQAQYIEDLFEEGYHGLHFNPAQNDNYDLTTNIPQAEEQALYAMFHMDVDTNGWRQFLRRSSPTIAYYGSSGVGGVVGGKPSIYGGGNPNPPHCPLNKTLVRWRHTASSGAVRLNLFYENEAAATPNYSANWTGIGDSTYGQDLDGKVGEIIFFADGPPDEDTTLSQDVIQSWDIFQGLLDDVSGNDMAGAYSLRVLAGSMVDAPLVRLREDGRRYRRRFLYF